MRNRIHNSFHMTNSLSLLSACHNSVSLKFHQMPQISQGDYEQMVQEGQFAETLVLDAQHSKAVINKFKYYQ